MLTGGILRRHFSKSTRGQSNKTEAKEESERRRARLRDIESRKKKEGKGHNVWRLR